MGYSTNELADRADLARMTIVRVEANTSDVRLGTLQAILKALHVDRDAWGRFMTSADS
jgi:transcriptional regulator with XRE-family HTH domain